jgi:phosphosulfolactate synthase
VNPLAEKASKRPRSTFFPQEIPRPQRPRKVGVTHVLDRLQRLAATDLTDFAPYIDVAKIGWGLPLLLPRERIRERIKAYHELGIEVSTGGTLLEYALTRERVSDCLDEARELGFDVIEVSNGILDLSRTQMERLATEIQRRSLDFFIEVGKKDIQQQLSLKETLDQIGWARAQHPRKVIIESRESGRSVGIYDGDGQIKWDWVRAILADHPRDELIFEAPMESQQVSLLRQLGSDVNLGNVSLTSVGPLASERQGLRGETFGAIRTSRAIHGPPAAKFLYYLLETYRGVDQSELVRISRLPRRTVQSALDSLRKRGLVEESVSLGDSRRREYRLL